MEAEGGNILSPLWQEISGKIQIELRENRATIWIYKFVVNTSSSCMIKMFQRLFCFTSRKM